MNRALNQKITLPSLLKFTLPSMVMMVVISLYSVVDGLFVARLIGTEAFSAVNIVYPLLELPLRWVPCPEQLFTIRGGLN